MHACTVSTHDYCNSTLRNLGPAYFHLHLCVCYRSIAFSILDLCKGTVFLTLPAKMAYANMMRSGLTASKTLTNPFCAGTGTQQLRRRPLTSRAYSRRQFAAMAQATYDIWVKGSPEKNELGDCEYHVCCMRSYGTLSVVQMSCLKVCNVGRLLQPMHALHVVVN